VAQALAIGVDGDLAAVDRCRRDLEAKADLTQYTTPIAIADLEEVRAALGYERINLFGASYGSRAALAYMRQYPTRVRSAILRAVAGTDLVLPLTVLADSERALHRLLGACEATSTCGAAYPMLERTLIALLARLKRTPVTIAATNPRTGAREEVRVNDHVFGTAIFFLLFVGEWARNIPAIIQAAADGDLRPFADALPLAIMTALPVHWGMRRSVLCSEDVTRTTEAEVRAVTEASLVNDPSNLGLVASCGRWPRGHVPDSYFEPVRSEVPVLAISGTEDPVLPPHRAEAALRTLPNAVHVVVPATAHGPTFPGCVAKLAGRFLDQASGKGLDTTCVLDVQRPPFTIRPAR
jgi:pimeloyl-ACP methyl ester carboxylesterase